MERFVLLARQPVNWILISLLAVLLGVAAYPNKQPNTATTPIDNKAPPPQSPSSNSSPQAATRPPVAVPAISTQAASQSASTMALSAMAVSTTTAPPPRPSQGALASSSNSAAVETVDLTTSTYYRGELSQHKVNHPDDGEIYEYDPDARITRAERLEVHSKLKSTCDRWTRWYQRDRSESARVNMNIACRDAADYGKSQLGLKVGKVKYVAAKARKKKKSKPQAQMLASRKLQPAYKGKPRCHYWEAQVDKIRSKLRAGYREPQGNKLRQQRRNYRRLIRDNC